MVKKTVALACALCLALCLPSAALGCECYDLSAVESYRLADAVLVGKVIKTARAKEARVGMVQKPRAGGTTGWEWNRYEVDVQSTTLEIGEAFKGVMGATVEVTSIVESPGSCGVGFREGESYLVYASKARPLLKGDAAKLPKERWTEEMRLKAEADEWNAKLPALATGMCLRTAELSVRAEDVNEIRRLIKK